MESLPRELIDAILRQCVALSPRNHILDLRLVCRAFDRFLKPFALRTIALEFSRLSKNSRRRQPDIDSLQTIGYHCKSMYIDLMVLRDELEVEFLSTIFDRIPSMKHFVQTLQRQYCMSPASFTTLDYRHTLESILFNCQFVSSLRLNLPFQLVGHRCNAATMILANTFSAFSRRPEDSLSLKTLVLENVSDQAIVDLWTNPSDVLAIMRAILQLEHLVISFRRHEVDPPRVAFYGTCLWDLIHNAEVLQTLCLSGTDDDRPPRGLKQTKAWNMTIDEWRARALPSPPITLPCLTALELKRVEITPDVLRCAARNFGQTLRELYLNEVYLKAEQGHNLNEDSKEILWVGLPNQRPGLHDDWMAMIIRESCPKLQTCRASFLGYDLYTRDDLPPSPAPSSPDFDFIDPCGLGRSIAQRFVEVALGYYQPPQSDGSPVSYLPALASNDYLLTQMRPRTRALRVTEYDVNAYQTAVRNSTSGWQRSIDSVFPNCNSGTLEELHYIAETACQGMNEIQRQRNEHAGQGEGGEGGAGDGENGGGGGGNLAENLLNLNFAEE
ncbi:uncharacterized protein CLUP02_12257 [Colletotrichum lupini]|uniref:Uncharacterized protein n=1 Tax=Colletotrichum lupini TaxID=145971 RepID=A0A9Q8T0X6_9PEZI|nr:uncharacterized protein CLUP02_12257 [Colletotrichum lupini]UQC86755.1 hypothetical protein CLUP02_12257 [Colletotrichum lupini]